jgi:nitroimidazol reductase NimA-like FMN-containing flavoprotein (pyridoxamine 5'-phosphate oxidase superfamily)
MNHQLRDLILTLLNENRVMTIATNRPDGWPQATIVGYVNDGFLLYSFLARDSQKYRNILRDSRVSITIGGDTTQPLQIKALSIAAKASEVIDLNERDYIANLRRRRYPEYETSPPALGRDSSSRMATSPSPVKVVLLRIAPEIFSVLDYSRGFGHSDLVAFSDHDLDVHVKSSCHRWDGNADIRAGSNANSP